MKTIFIVDDNNVNLLAAEDALTEHYRPFTLPSAASMFELIKDIMPDLILLDIEMPEIDGFETIRRLKANEKYKNVPVIFLTSRKDADSEALGFELGAVDFISKPFSESVLRNRIKMHLDVEAIIREQTNELQKLKDSIITVLASVVENRDMLTGGHIERTASYIKILIEAMRERGVYAEEIDKWDLDSVILSARLHDVGKVIVSDLILNKPGKLTDEEMETMKNHAIKGEQIIDDIILGSGNQVFLHDAKLFAGCHHERWDGTGYPRGLKQDDIPLQGRIMAIADVYDALVSERPYKRAFSHEKALDIIMESKGTHFDPKIVDTFLAVSDSFAQVGEAM